VANYSISRYDAVKIRLPISIISDRFFNEADRPKRFQFKLIVLEFFQVAQGAQNLTASEGSGRMEATNMNRL
jgi:hypothetical protein